MNSIFFQTSEMRNKYLHTVLALRGKIEQIEFEFRPHKYRGRKGYYQWSKLTREQKWKLILGDEMNRKHKFVHDLIESGIQDIPRCIVEMYEKLCLRIHYYTLPGETLAKPFKNEKFNEIIKIIVGSTEVRNIQIKQVALDKYVFQEDQRKRGIILNMTHMHTRTHTHTHTRAHFFQSFYYYSWVFRDETSSRKNRCEKSQTRIDKTETWLLFSGTTPHRTPQRFSQREYRVNLVSVREGELVTVTRTVTLYAVALQSTLSSPSRVT